MNFHKPHFFESFPGWRSFIMIGWPNLDPLYLEMDNSFLILYLPECVNVQCILPSTKMLDFLELILGHFIHNLHCINIPVLNYLLLHFIFFNSIYQVSCSIIFSDQWGNFTKSLVCDKFSFSPSLTYLSREHLNFI